MNHKLLVYTPCTKEPDPKWLVDLPTHDLLRSREELVRAIEVFDPLSTQVIVLLRPVSRTDLEALSNMSFIFRNCKVIVALPDKHNDSLLLIAPLQPRYFSFGGESPEYTISIINKMVSSNSGSWQIA